MSLFKRRRQEHRKDEMVRQNTIEVLKDHKKSVERVRKTLRRADETLGAELRRLERAVGGM
jgi:hypothetical protein